MNKIYQANQLYNSKIGGADMYIMSTCYPKMVARYQITFQSGYTWKLPFAPIIFVYD